MKRHLSGLIAISGVLGLLASGCASPTPTPTVTVEPAIQPTIQPTALPSEEPSPTPQGKLPTPNLPTATLPVPAEPEDGHYENADLGISFEYPQAWAAEPGAEEPMLVQLIDFANSIVVIALHGSMPAEATLEEMAAQLRDEIASSVGNAEHLKDEAITLDDGSPAWFSEFSAARDDGSAVQVIVVTTTRSGQFFTLLAFGEPDNLETDRRAIDDMIASIRLEAPRVYGIPRDQALFLPGGESTNPRDYDPANGNGSDLVFSGLVAFNPQLEIVPDLAEAWDIGPDGTVYTFHLRRHARFHDGRPVTAHDVIYSWERAANPETDSDTVLTYLGDIVGVRDRHEGKAETIRGLRAIDDHTLQVTIDAPKPYFLMKLTFSTAYVVDRANVESGAEWYRTPNGTGPYQLIRWDKFKLQLYERDEDFYLDPPAIRFVVSQLFAGVPIRLYETGDIDVTGVGSFDADRVRDPSEPLHADLLEGVSMCTSFVTFDVTQPPFEDAKVRQAFALAVDRQRYIDVVLRGVSIPARGLYPPALPGYDLDFEGLEFDPDLARQRLAESTYGSAGKLPPIVFTDGGYGSDVDSGIAALAQMWQTNLGVTIQVENLDPNKFFDELHDGNHGQLFSYGWCADYPDPENFADVLFHSGAQQNLGHYADPDLDALLEAARVERDVDERIAMYQRAERMLVDDAAAIFLHHHLSFLLVKPHIKGYVLVPIAVPIERYLSIDPEEMK